MDTLKKELEFFQPSLDNGALIPSMEALIAAGFPSPADDFLEKSLNLHELVVKHPAATFFVKVIGDSMKDASINSGDILVVDRSVEPTSGKIVVAILNGEFTVKRLQRGPLGQIWLAAANAAYPPIPVSEDSDFQVWGVVTYVIHKT